MTFTDDDLKWLKAHNSSIDQATDYAEPRCHIKCETINALIARLEASEDCARKWEEYTPQPETDMYLVAWRKSKGV